MGESAVIPIYDNSITEGSAILHPLGTDMSCCAPNPNTYPGVTAFEMIGEGSFGEVYRCAVEDIRGEVAVKVLKAWMSPQAFREVQTLHQADHPNVMRLLRVLRRGDNDPPALVLELCPGGTLAELLHGSKGVSPKPLRLTQRSQACHEVALALEFLHAQVPRIMHRDVKTANVFLAGPVLPDGKGVALPRMKLGDLGLAKFVDDDPDLNTAGIGTFHYMAPEVMAGDPYCESADVFSFAIVLHETTSGQLPYNHSMDPRLAMKVAAGLRPPKGLLPAGPAGDVLFALLERCWCTEPEERLSAPVVSREMLALLSIAADATG